MISLLNSDAFTLPLKAECVHVALTSWPYWNLRDYDVEGQFGLEPHFDCMAWVGGVNQVVQLIEEARKIISAPAADPELKLAFVDALLGEMLKAAAKPSPPCGECYICRCREVAAETWRVLRKDGTFWLNMGDAFSSSGKGGPGKRRKMSGSKTADARSKGKRTYASKVGLRKKNLLGIPFRVALALQADGWNLRSDNIWSKSNPMSESVRDRPSRSHEYVFMFSKGQRYFYDYEASREPLAQSSIERIMQKNFFNQTGGESDYANGDINNNRSSRRAVENLAKRVRVGGANFGSSKADGYGRRRYSGNGWSPSSLKRNRRTVWELSTKGYKGAHYATFPPDLARYILEAAASHHGCCPHCGSQFKRKVVEEFLPADPDKKEPDSHGALLSETIGWEQSCKCEINDPPMPVVILDPCVGSGTTLEVVSEMGGNFHGIGGDLSFPYLVFHARERSGLGDLDRFFNGIPGQSGDLSELPIFGGKQ